MKIASKESFERPKLYGKKENLVYFTKTNPIKDTENEDAIGIFPFSNRGYVLAVADGAGGHPKGEEAALTILNQIQRTIEAAQKDLSSLRIPILDAIEEANKQLIAEGVGSRTTISVCEILDGRARGYQVGDSSLVICGQRGKVKYRSTSHSPVGYGVESGYIDEKEALEHPDLHYISNLVGEADMKMEVGPEIPLNPNDTIFLASDGIFDNFSTHQVVEVIRKGSLSENAEDLMSSITESIYNNPNAKLDDISFILYKHA